MTPAEQTAMARECGRIVLSRIPEDEQVQQAVLIGSDFGLGRDEAVFQLNMAHVYYSFDLELLELHDEEGAS